MAWHGTSSGLCALSCMRLVVYATSCLCDILSYQPGLMCHISLTHRLSYMPHHFKWHSMTDMTFYFTDILPNIFNSIYTIILHRVIGICCSHLISSRMIFSSLWLSSPLVSDLLLFLTRSPHVISCPWSETTGDQKGARRKVHAERCSCDLMSFPSHLLSSSRTRNVWWCRAGSVWEPVEFDVSWSNSWDMRAPEV